MGSRCNQQADLPLYVKPQFSWHGSTGKVMVMCGTKNTRGKDVEDVVVTIPFPKSVATVTFSANCGSVHYDDMSRVRVSLCPQRWHWRRGEGDGVRLFVRAS